MATPTDLVKVIAATTGEDEATVAQHDRNLVIAGLRAKHGRGPSTYKPTARDGAVLLTSVRGSHRVRDGVATIRRYLQTQEHRAHWAQHYPADKQGGMGPANVWEQYGIPELAALPPEHTFIDALTVLITLATEGRLNSELQYYGAQDLSCVRIMLFWPQTHARISMHSWRDPRDEKSHKSVQADYQSNEPPPAWIKECRQPLPEEIAGQSGIKPQSDRWSETNALPLLYIGALLAGKIDELPKIKGDCT